MGGLKQQLKPLAFLICIIFLTSFVVPTRTAGNYNLFTRIKEITIPPTISYLESYPNWTFFEFECDFEIINTSGETLYILTLNTNLVYIFGTLSFENNQYIGEIWGPNIIFPAGTNHTIVPGFNNDTTIIYMRVNDTLTSLPDGNFSVWINIDDYEDKIEYYSYTSEIRVNDTDIQIIYGGENETFTFPTEPVPTTFSYIQYIIVSIMIFAYLKKRLKLNYSDKLR